MLNVNRMYLIYQWEYANEDAKDYEWEYETEEEEETESEDEVVDREVARRASLEENGKNGHENEGDDDDEIPLEEQELPDPLSSVPLEATTTKSKSRRREVICLLNVILCNF